MNELFVDSWGTGTPVVLVHGSLATGAEEWQAQRQLADEGFHLFAPDRRGYGRSPAAEGEDFLRDADALSAELIAIAVPLVPVLRRGRPLWSEDLPLAEVAAARFPKLVVSGGHSIGFDAICDDLAERIGASRAVATGAGHEVQFAGGPINDLLLALWRDANPRGLDKERVL